MSPKKESKKTSPKKTENTAIEDNNFETTVNESLSKPKSTGLKLRLKVSSKESVTLPSATLNDSTATATQEVKMVPKIKLNFSRSNESVIEEERKAAGKRGRPKKDKSAVLAAAIAASQPNEIESEERKSRRKAAEEKIKKSASMDSVTSATSSSFEGDTEDDGGKRRRGRRPSDETEEEDGKRRKRRSREDSITTKTTNTPVTSSLNESARSRLSKSNEFIDITDGPVVRTHIANQSTSGFNPHETEFIQRSKTFLNIAMQHDTFLYTSNLSNPLEVTPFKSIEDAVEKLLAYHVGIGAGQYSKEELEGRDMTGIDNDKHVKKYEELQEKYKSVIQVQSTKKVSTELLLLEQRLCLEEEKFLLVKLKNEYAAKFMKGPTTSSASTSSSRPASMPSSRPNSVVNQ